MRSSGRVPCTQFQAATAWHPAGSGRLLKRVQFQSASRAMTVETIVWAIFVAITVGAATSRTPPSSSARPRPAVVARPVYLCAGYRCGGLLMSLSRLHMRHTRSRMYTSSQCIRALELQAVWVYGLNLVRRWQYRHIPGPPPKWLLGNAAEIKAKMMHGSYEQWSRKHGPVCRIFLGMQPIVIITGLFLRLPACSNKSPVPALLCPVSTLCLLKFVV